MFPARALRSVRVLGDDAVLGLLARVGRKPRTFANLIEAGFPPGQLEDARRIFVQSAETPVERHAVRRMTQGWLDDEELVVLFCRFYGCTDWRLESSALFYARDDYERFYGALLSPIAFETNLLEGGDGEAAWSGFFLKLPFDLGMQKARAVLWDAVCHREYFWHPLKSYRDLRADQLFQYLARHVDVTNFSKDIFFFNWEREFRVRLGEALYAFQQALEHALRRWREARNRERRRAEFRANSFAFDAAGLVLGLREALASLELDPRTATLAELRRNFRRLSLKAHPDQGGSDESFRLLAACRQIAEEWIRARGM